jgi:hypothetical protein
VIERFPDDRLTVVVLANRDDLDARALALRPSHPAWSGIQNYEPLTARPPEGC